MKQKFYIYKNEKRNGDEKKIPTPLFHPYNMNEWRQKK